MKRFIIIVTAASIALFSCSSKPDVNLKNPLESGRGFIEASLKGDYIKAEHYLLKDSTNMEYLNNLREFNKNSSKIERQNYSESNIIIDSIKDVSDSVSIIFYSNTYKKEPTKIKMVKKNTDWLVDFKFTFNEEPK